MISGLWDMEKENSRIRFQIIYILINMSQLLQEVLKILTSILCFIWKDYLFVILGILGGVVGQQDWLGLSRMLRWQCKFCRYDQCHGRSMELLIGLKIFQCSPNNMSTFAYGSWRSWAMGPSVWPQMGRTLRDLRCTTTRVSFGEHIQCPHFH